MNQIVMNESRQKLFNELAKHGIRRHDEDLPLYKYVDIATAKKILKGTIKFSTPYELDDNDMDMSLLKPNITDEQKTISAKEMLQKGLNDKYTSAEQKLFSKIIPFDSFSKDISTVTYEKLIMDGYAEQRKKVGIFCLAKTNNSSRMWRDYADKDKGVCIEFKFPTLFNKLFYTFCVNYNNADKPSNLFDENGEQDEVAINRWLFTKSERYASEDEVRIISNNVIGIIDIEKVFISGLYYGKSTSNRSINYLEFMLRNGGYNFKTGSKVKY